MTAWFIQHADGELGPLRPGELLQRVRDGQVKPETMIRKDNSAWFEASQVGGLFEAAMRPTIEHFCPHCGGPVGEPPCRCRCCGREVEQARTRITENTIAGDADPHRPGQSGRSVQRWLKKVRQKKED